MIEVFADSVYYIALLNPSDQFHAAAIAATRTLTLPMLTTEWILTEVADALSAPTVRERTFRFLKRVALDANTRILSASPQWYERGLTLYGDRPDKAWSLTDCISFSVMTQHGVTEALTGDHHFTQAGFRALLLTATHHA